MINLFQRNKDIRYRNTNQDDYFVNWDGKSKFCKAITAFKAGGVRKGDTFLIKPANWVKCPSFKDYLNQL